MAKKCAKCGVTGDMVVTHTAICSECGAGFPLCNNCTISWKNQKSCPNCGAAVYRAKWKIY